MAVSSSRAMSSPRRRLERLKGSPPLKIASRASGTLRSSASAADQSARAASCARVRELAAKAVAAMQRAGAARDQQHAARILLDEPGCREPLLADGIGREARDGRQAPRRAATLGAAAGRADRPCACVPRTRAGRAAETQRSPVRRARPAAGRAGAAAPRARARRFAARPATTAPAKHPVSCPPDRWPASKRHRSCEWG